METKSTLIYIGSGNTVISVVNSLKLRITIINLSCNTIPLFLGTVMSPKTKRNIQRIIPFGIIWLIVGCYNMSIESMATGNVNANPDTQITLTIPIFLFACVAVTMVGFLIGFIEVVWLEKVFSNQSFGKKLLYKFGIYASCLFLVILITYPIAASMELHTSISDPAVWQKLRNFLVSISFISTIVSIAFSLLLSLIYAGISENIGYRVFINLLSGKYQEPKEERRIFLFLDMKSSTSIAEQLGHKRYFKFLQRYYNCLSDSIIEHQGEVYQYIGDEVVISWKYKQGEHQNNCISCFDAMKKALQAKQSEFIKQFGCYPTFKAGIHLGAVTTGEIGALKKEIFYTGDVLNTASRLQELCNRYATDLILSEAVLQALELESQQYQLLDEVDLRGKNQKIKVYTLPSS